MSKEQNTIVEKSCSSKGISFSFLKYQLKNSRGVVWGYIIIYLLLIILSIVIRLGSEEVSLYDKVGYCSIPIHICTCILSAFPMMFLASEIIENDKHPYMFVYAFRWDRRDNLYCYLMSLIFPAVVYILLGILYRGAYNDGVYDKGGLARNAVYHLAIVFVLNALAFLVAMLTRKVLISLICVLAYTIVMLFMDVSDVWFNVIALGNSIAVEAIPRMISWLLAGVIINEIGMWIYHKKICR